MRLYLTGAEGELPHLPPGLGYALVDPCFGASPDAALRGREGVLLLGGGLEPERTSAAARECRRRGIRAVAAGFGRSSALDTLRFCDAMLRQGITPILPEENWVSGCGGERLISTAVSGGTLEERLRETLQQSPDLALDLERLRHRFPLPCPEGRGTPIPPEELEARLSGGAPSAFSRELLCRAMPLDEGEASCFILYDDRETLCEKVRLAAALGVRRGFLLYPEWSPEDAAAALEAAEGQGKSPAISG